MNKHNTLRTYLHGIKEECPVCRKYANFFIRDYDSCHAVYHDNHCCTCGHLHDNRKEYCEGGKDCGCRNFQAKDGSKTKEKPKPSKFKNFKNGDDLICENRVYKCLGCNFVGKELDALLHQVKCDNAMELLSKRSDL